ncbi:hypothetical protein [Xanthomonas translucens]|uniref:START domain-containing protein n=1 Tax=Xanthomonas translucens pv. translucens TaxID=134875 RepID=A0ABW9L0S8_XANCT|nr:hypothetical protein [Xanthomonas translucens]
MAKKLICEVKGLDAEGKWSVSYGVRGVKWSHPSVVDDVVGDFERTKDAIGASFFVPSADELKDWVNGGGLLLPPTIKHDARAVRAEKMDFITSCVPKYFDDYNRISVCSIQILDAKGNPVPGLPISYLIFSPSGGGEVKLVVGKSLMDETLSMLAKFLAAKRKPASIVQGGNSPSNDRKAKGFDMK